MERTTRRIRFGGFEFDPHSGDLCRNGRCRALQEQPLAILKALLDRPGEIVRREELCPLLWPSQTFVDVEHGLNAAVKRLRDALGDNADVPHFIETIPRRGYRFIAPVTVAGDPAPPADGGAQRMPAVPRLATEVPQPDAGSAEPSGVEAPHPHTASTRWAVSTWQVTFVTATFVIALLIGGALFSKQDPTSAAGVARGLFDDLGAGWFARASRPRSVASRSIRFEIPPPPATAVDPAHADARISPDGRLIVFVAWQRGRSALWVRPLDSLTASPLSGTDGAAQPFWSPDARFVGFQADGMLRKVPIDAGPVQQLCMARHVAGATWGSAGVIVFSQLHSLFRIPEGGGTPTPIPAPAGIGNDAVVVQPIFLPDGRRFLFRVGHGRPEAKGTYLASLDDESSTRLFDVGVNVAYGAQHIFFVRSKTLFARPFDVDAPDAAHEPVALATDVFENLGQTSGPSISVSDGGTLVYRQPGIVESELAWFDRSGNALGGLRLPEACANPEISGDDALVAVECRDVPTGQRDVWIVRPSGGAPTRVTTHPAGGSDAVWSPDGEWLAFSSDRGGARNLYRRPWRRAGVDELIHASPATKYPSSWSRNGRLLAFTARASKSGWDVWVLSLATSEPRQLVATRANEIEPQFSPDSRWLAYSSDETGRWEVYLRAIDGDASARPTTISGAAGGSDARWGANGDELFYLAPDRTLMVVELRGPSRDPGPPTALFATRTVGPLGLGVRFNYAVTSDGQRFLMSVADRTAMSTPYVVAYDALARRRDD